MSPRTSTWTEILGSFADAEETALGGEWLTYRLGRHRRTTVKIVEAMVASVRSSSSIVTWLQQLFWVKNVLIHLVQIISRYLTPFPRLVISDCGELCLECRL